MHVDGDVFSSSVLAQTHDVKGHLRTYPVVYMGLCRSVSQRYHLVVFREVFVSVFVCALDSL